MFLPYQIPLTDDHIPAAGDPQSVQRYIRIEISFCFIVKEHSRIRCKGFMEQLMLQEIKAFVQGITD
jgi:hypothetical protein